MRGSSVIVYLMNFTIGLAQALIGLRIILKLFGASQNAPFVQWIYKTSQPLLHPFEGMFPAPVLDGGFVVEFSALFAIIIYTLVGYFLAKLVIMFDEYLNSK